MFPSRSVYDCLESVTANAVIIPHCVTGRALGMPKADFDHLAFSQFVSWVIDPFAVLSVLTENSFEDSRGVDEVFTASDDLKVFQSIVVFNSVDMVDYHVIWNGADEKLVNKTVDFKRFDAWSSRPQGDDVVSVFVYTAVNDLPSSSEYSASVGDLIPFPTGKVCPGFVFHSETIQ